jgi:hypothetical protein
LKINRGGAPTTLARKIAAAKTSAGKNSFPFVPLSLKVLIKIQNLDFRQKKFGF